MKKFILSFAIVAALVITPVATVLLPPDGDTLVDEQRSRADFPEIPKNTRNRSIKRYFNQIDKFIADNLPFRGLLLTFASGISGAIGTSQDFNTAFKGKENWLFLGNKHANILDKLQGRLVLDESSIGRGLEKYLRLSALAREKGADFSVLICPNKSTVYPEFLPVVVYPASKRYIAPGLAALREHGVKVYDATDVLLRSKNKGLLYYRTDSHWNLLGAASALSGLLDYLELPPLRGYDLSPGSNYLGDIIPLGDYRNVPVSAGDNYVLSWRETFKIRVKYGSEDFIAAGERQISFEELKNGVSIYNAQATTDLTAWIYGDSFIQNLSPFLDSVFKQIHYRHYDFFLQDSQDPQLPRPDIILLITVERMFM